MRHLCNKEHNRLKEVTRADHVRAHTNVPQAAIDAVAAAVVVPPIELTWVRQGIFALLDFVAPHKALEKQKRYLQWHCRKPKDMKTWVFVNHLARINYQEMCYLPFAFSVAQRIPPDELVDIVVNSIPRKWTREMDRLDFDPAEHTLNEVVAFCETMEAAEEQDNVSGRSQDCSVCTSCRN
jgi:hypothetical protein